MNGFEEHAKLKVSGLFFIFSLKHFNESFWNATNVSESHFMIKPSSQQNIYKCTDFYCQRMNVPWEEWLSGSNLLNKIPKGIWNIVR